MIGTISERIDAFKARLESEREFCEELFRESTIRLLAFKYAYYVCGQTLVKDVTYDNMEQSWFVMGRALGHLTEDETSPCVGWKEDHPLAKDAIALAVRLGATA